MPEQAQQELLDAQPVEDNHDQLTRTWKRNVRMVHLGNFLHMVMYTMCLGGIFDVFLYHMSTEEQDLFKDEVLLGSPSCVDECLPQPIDFIPYNEFEFKFEFMPMVHPPTASNDKALRAGSSVLTQVTDLRGEHLYISVTLRNGTTVPELFADVGGKTLSCAGAEALEPESWRFMKVKSVSAENAKGHGDVQPGEHGVQLYADGALVCEVKAKVLQPHPDSDHLLFWWGPSSQDPRVATQGKVRNLIYGKPASNLFVGVMNSLQGIMAMGLMYPVGWLGDKGNRYSVLRWNVLIGAMAGGILAFGVLERSMACLWIGVVVFTFYQQTISTLINAVLADNTQSSDRTAAAVNYKTFSALAMSLGPFLQFLVCLSDPDQDEWSNGIFDILLVPGWAVLPFVGIVMLAFTTVGERISSIPNTDEDAKNRAVNGSPQRSKRQRLDEKWLDQIVFLGQRRRFVVAASANAFFIFTLLANGMTVRYFSLYFTNVQKFSPGQLCLLNAGCRLFIAAFAQLGKHIAPCLGRTNAAILLHIGSALFTLGIYGGGLFTPNIWLSCGSYYMRFACLHTRDPIISSLTMDTVPPEQRSRWSALNSLRSLSFSASAVLGGWLADRWGYEFSFTVTVYALLACTVLMLPTAVIFPRQERYADPAVDTPQVVLTSGK